MLLGGNELHLSAPSYSGTCLGLLELKAGASTLTAKLEEPSRQLGVTSPPLTSLDRRTFQLLISKRITLYLPVVGYPAARNNTLKQGDHRLEAGRGTSHRGGDTSTSQGVLAANGETGTQRGPAVVPSGTEQLSSAKHEPCWGRERHLSYTCSLSSARSASAAAWLLREAFLAEAEETATAKPLLVRITAVTPLH